MLYSSKQRENLDLNEFEISLGARNLIAKALLYRIVQVLDLATQFSKCRPANRFQEKWVITIADIQATLSALQIDKLNCTRSTLKTSRYAPNIPETNYRDLTSSCEAIVFENDRKDTGQVCHTEKIDISQYWLIVNGHKVKYSDYGLDTCDSNNLCFENTVKLNIADQLGSSSTEDVEKNKKYFNNSSQAVVVTDIINHCLSKEHGVFLNSIRKIVRREMILSSSNIGSSLIFIRCLKTVSSSSCIGQLLPFLVHFVQAEITIATEDGNLPAIKTILLLLQALISNSTLRLHHVLHQILDVLLKRVLLYQPYIKFYLLRPQLAVQALAANITANLVTQLCTQLDPSTNDVIQLILQQYAFHLINPDTPLPSALGALMGLRSLHPAIAVRVFSRLSEPLVCSMLKNVENLQREQNQLVRGALGADKSRTQKVIAVLKAHMQSILLSEFVLLTTYQLRHMLAACISNVNVTSMLSGHCTDRNEYTYPFNFNFGLSCNLAGVDSRAVSSTLAHIETVYEIVGDQLTPMMSVLSQDIAEDEALSDKSCMENHYDRTGNDTMRPVFDICSRNPFRLLFTRSTNHTHVCALNSNRIFTAKFSDRSRNAQEPNDEVLGLFKRALASIAAVATVTGAVSSYLMGRWEVQSLDKLPATLVERFEAFNIRSTDYISDFLDEYFPHAQDPLLPDFKTLEFPENLPTLVIDLDKTIVHLEHDRRIGWRVLKRPGAERFFKELMHYYELVVWSDDCFPVAQDVMVKWGVPVVGCIHRDQCKKRQGHYVKDLRRLGRNLSRVIILDHDSKAFQLQPENGLLIKEFSGDESDDELENLIDLLRSIALSGEDVRTQLSNYGGGQNPEIGRNYMRSQQRTKEKAEARRSMGRVFGITKSASSFGPPKN